MLYLIAYDLKKPHDQYPELIAAIKAAPSCFHVELSVWFINSQRSAQDWLDRLKPHLKGGDRLIVFPLAHGWVSYGLKDGADWLNRQEW